MIMYKFKWEMLLEVWLGLELKLYGLDNFGVLMFFSIEFMKYVFY